MPAKNPASAIPKGSLLGLWSELTWSNLRKIDRLIKNGKLSAYGL